MIWLTSMPPEEVALPTENAECNRRVAFCGLINRRERWGLSWRGRVVIAIVLAALLVAIVRGVHPFLAVTHREKTEYLVVEGWIPNYALKQALAEFRQGGYTKLYTVGGQTLNGVNVEVGDSYAESAGKRLRWLGLPTNCLQAVPSAAVYRHRTFHSGLALRAWFEQRGVPVKALNVVTLDAHARRSRLLFERAFEGKVRVGIISVPHREYDARSWWKYSDGFKEVVPEAVAYVYARLFFRPKPIIPGVDDKIGDSLPDQAPSGQ